jgi:hypothetical protein
MKYGMIILCLVLAGSLAAQSADTLFVLSSPQFTNPFYDAFSQNYIGVEAAGRGYTGAAVPGTAQAAYINPATMMADSAKVFIEVNIKPPVRTEGLAFESRYSSPMPFAVAGVSFPVGQRLAASISYNNPKSIVLDDFSILINQGADVITRYPKYQLHQFSGMASYQLSSQWKLGLSLHNQIHYLDDVIFLRTYDRIREYKYALRFQPGLLYQGEALAVGLSATLPTEMQWDLRYARYDTVLPLQLSTGLSFTKDNYRFSTDFNYGQDSAIDDAFEDRYSIHLGAERRNGNKILRAGYFYRSNVWDGQLLLPVNTSAQADSSIFWDDVSTTLPVPENSQHFLSLGYGYLFRDGSINLSALSCVAGETKTTQINLSLSLYLSSFKREDFLRFP